MIFANNRRMMTGLLVACAISGPFAAHAGSASISVSINFAVAPVDLLRARAIAPEAVRSCESLKMKIRDVWTDQKRQPTLDCVLPENVPLIVTSLNGPDLIVRP